MASPKFDNELHSASESYDMAINQTYLKEVELEAIATQINTAARGGHTKCIYQSIMSDYAKEQLESKGYKIIPGVPDQYSTAVVISWDKQQQ